MNKQQVNIPGMPSHLSSLSDEELGKLVAELKEYEGLEIKTIVATAEIVFCDQHFCNDNLRQTQKVAATVPKSGKAKRKAKDSDEEFSEDQGFDDNGKPIFKDETFKVKPDVIIAKNEKSKKTLKELEKVLTLGIINEFIIGIWRRP